MSPGFLRRAVRAVFGRGQTDALVSVDAAPIAGRSGPDATVEIDPRELRAVRLGYAPTPDGDPDPGEVVWTWVPYEERDGRGKDRPVVIVAEHPGGGFLAVQLTSKPHTQKQYYKIGPGPWDPQGRPSWALLDRVFLVQSGGVRREGSSMDAARYAGLVRALGVLYGWA